MVVLPLIMIWQYIDMTHFFFVCVFFRLAHRCYLEMALIHLQEFVQIPPPSGHLTPPPSPTPDETSKVLWNVFVYNSRVMYINVSYCNMYVHMCLWFSQETVRETYLLLCWICLRIALKVGIDIIHTSVRSVFNANDSVTFYK